MRSRQERDPTQLTIIRLLGPMEEFLFRTIKAIGEVYNRILKIKIIKEVMHLEDPNFREILEKILILKNSQTISHLLQALFKDKISRYNQLK